MVCALLGHAKTTHNGHHMKSSSWGTWELKLLTVSLSRGGSFFHKGGTFCMQPIWMPCDIMIWYLWYIVMYFSYPTPAQTLGVGVEEGYGFLIGEPRLALLFLIWTTILSGNALGLRGQLHWKWIIGHGIHGASETEITWGWGLGAGSSYQISYSYCTLQT